MKNTGLIAILAILIMTTAIVKESRKGAEAKMRQEVLKQTAERYLKMPNIPLKEDSVIKWEFLFRGEKIYYIATLGEIANFFDNKTIYGGYLNARDGGTGIPNLNCLIARKNEPSFKKFVSSLTKGTKNNEEKAQLLLNFVSTKIRYDDEEAEITKAGGCQTFKRADEVLRSRLGTCREMVVLLASFLEQTDINYYVLYYEDHVTVAVEGNYKNLNGLNFLIGQKKIFIAEPTVKGFKIGESQVNRDLGIDNLMFYQKPGVDAPILIKKGKPLPWS